MERTHGKSDGRVPATARRLVTATIVGLSIAIAAASKGPGLESLSHLKDGNARFVSNPSAALPGPPAGRIAPGPPQRPRAAVLSCADARVPPEVIFHAGVGDLFVVRAAGHVADRSILASLEYATERLQVPLLVIMGHEACDVIGAAAQPSTAGATHLEYLLKAIKPSIDRVASEPAGTRTRSAILGHVEETINQMLESSSIVRGRAESGQLVIAGAYYEMSTGRVHFSDPVLVPPRPATRAASPAPAPRGTKPAAAASPRTSAPRAGK